MALFATSWVDPRSGGWGEGRTRGSSLLSNKITVPLTATWSGLRVLTRRRHKTTQSTRQAVTPEGAKIGVCVLVWGGLINFIDGHEMRLLFIYVSIVFQPFTFEHNNVMMSYVKRAVRICDWIEVRVDGWVGVCKWTIACVLLWLLSPHGPDY